MIGYLNALYLRDKYLVQHDNIYDDYISDSITIIFEKYIRFQTRILPKVTFLFWVFLLLNIIMDMPLIAIVLFLVAIYIALGLILESLLITSDF